jgi:hypothetical protein
MFYKSVGYGGYTNPLLHFIVFVVLKDIFIFVFLKSFVIVLVSVPKYVKVAHFCFCVSLVLWFCFWFV